MNKQIRLKPVFYRLLHLTVALAFIALGVIGMNRLTASNSQLKKLKPTSPVPVVRTIRVKAGPQSIIVRAEGTVRPLRQIHLVPQVDGKVVYVSSALVNGGEFKTGDTLLRIDPTDYQLAVALAKAKVKDAESLCKLTQEEADAAQEEWRIHYESENKRNCEPPPLVAKEPQLEAARARLEAEQAQLKKALLNLERTELKAPFNGRISEENIDTGQHVLLGQSLAILYSIEAAEIVLPIDDKKLFWFHVPGFMPGNSPGSPAVVRACIAGRKRTWPAVVVRSEGQMDEQTRLINVVVRVEKPYATKPPLVAGLFVSVDIKGHILPNAAIIPESALHSGDVVWVIDKDNRIVFRKVDIAQLQGDSVIVRSGLKDGENVVTTLLRAVTDGMAVRIMPGKEKDRS
ncbi:efflux RND transporter periplasmic adaptor subunit [bacterium]|nr:efflux RND transporter periplasmic adaptor subunit [bacterium]